MAKGKLADIGLVGLAVMGENLVLNMESKGFTVAVFNRTVSKVDDFMNARGKGKKFIGCRTIEAFVAALSWLLDEPGLLFADAARREEKPALVPLAARLVRRHAQAFFVRNDGGLCQRAGRPADAGRTTDVVQEGDRCRLLWPEAVCALDLCARVEEVSVIPPY